MRVIFKTELVGRHEREIFNAHYKEATEGKDLENIDEEDYQIIMNHVICKTLVDPRMGRIKLDYNESEGETALLFEMNLERWDLSKPIL
ncbi:MAG: hypothetical protein P4M08_01350 [Oligoflexia bacterium]|nr:hypothetical protein [Oligoflexia bacterium]